MSNREGAEEDMHQGKLTGRRKNLETDKRRYTVTQKKKPEFFEKHDQFEQKFVCR